MNYEGLRDTAITPIIKQYGYSMTLQLSSSDVIDPNTGIITVGTPTQWSVNGIEAYFEFKDIDGSRIKSGDKLVILSTDGSIPTPNADYKLIMANEVWDILSCKPIQPGGVVLTFELHVRR